ncbi:VanZ family protein [Photobacterium sagamiensis]
MVTFCISLLVDLAASTYQHQPPANLFNRTFICLFVLFSADELLQLLSIYRHFSFADLTANYVGLLLGWIVSRLLLKTTTKDHSHCS